MMHVPLPLLNLRDLETETPLCQGKPSGNTEAQQVFRIQILELRQRKKGLKDLPVSQHYSWHPLP